MKPPTPDQHTFLSDAVRRGGHLRQAHTLTTRMWMTAMVQMNKKGYIRWEGPRPFISEVGLRALGTRRPPPVPVCKHMAGPMRDPVLDAGSQLGGS